MSVFLPRPGRLGPFLFLADAVLLATAGWLSHIIRFDASSRSIKWDELFAQPAFLATGAAMLFALVVATELYEPFVLRRRRELLVRVVVVSLAWGGLLALATYFVPSWRFGRGLLLLTATFWAVLAASLRMLLRYWRSIRFKPPALVVGESSAVASFCAKLGAHPLSQWAPIDGSGIGASDMASHARQTGAEIVILVGAEANNSLLAQDLATLHFSGVPVVVASEMWAWLDGRLPVSDLTPGAFLHQPGFGAVHWQLFNRFTRVLDVILSGVILLLGAPLVALASLAILLTDGRPLFFVQTRVGQFGRHFRLIKLRTMQRDAEQNGPEFALENDPRATRVGQFLRRVRIDELPQLINVLKGEMSLVGPRPERPEFAVGLAAAIPFYAFRLAVPPGLTGWAQVSMPYARTTEEHRLRLEYDLYFIRERSVGLYILTLLRTVSVALAGPQR